MSNENIDIILKKYSFKKLNTNNIPLTKFEKTRILGERASQIENGTKILISNPERFDNAYKIAEPKDSVLLSPACSSFDLFKNYEDRGNQFKDAVRKL